MKVGKISTEILKEIIFSNISKHRPEVLVPPGIGEDCSVIDFGEYACVMSSDPITGASKGIGELAVHISCNDVASNGVEPIGIMLTILAPEGTTKEELREIMVEANRAATSINVEIIGGHTEITDAVNRVVISATAIGKQHKARLITSKGAKAGDAVIMTKHAGLEGAAIIANDYYQRLEPLLGEASLAAAIGFSNQLSVVKEGVLAGKIGVSSMHDATEGGILGAAWELAEASGLGIELYEEKIPVLAETLEICKLCEINPLKLISSGVMVMAVSPDKKAELIDALRAENITATEIGKLTEGERLFITSEGAAPLLPPEVDELYKAGEGLLAKT